MIKNFYKCECGKEFDNPQKFNGHKSHCIVHLNFTNKLDKKLFIDLKRAQDIHLTACKKREQRIKQEKDKWIAEQHKCEHCGKIMSEKYGSGRFCSRFCANSRPSSIEKKLKTSQTLKLTQTERTEKRKETFKSRYYANPNICPICGKIIDYEQRRLKICVNCSTLKKIKVKQLTKICPICGKLFSAKTKYCSKECCRKGQSQTRKNLFAEGKLTQHSVKGIYHYGTYKGIVCDSSWELAFVMYLIDHDIKFTRNWFYSFEYTLDGEKHRFIPDFLIGDTLYEIKGKVDNIAKAKQEAIPSNIKFKMLFKKDIKPYITYAIQNYGKDFDSLYDKDKPSWLDKFKN